MIWYFLAGIIVGFLITLMFIQLSAKFFRWIITSILYNYAEANYKEELKNINKRKLILKKILNGDKK